MSHEERKSESECESEEEKYSWQFTVGIEEKR
jgi:hypothetical protein